MLFRELYIEGKNTEFRYMALAPLTLKLRVLETHHREDILVQITLH